MNLIMEFIAFFQNQIASNQFSQGAIVAGVVGGLLAWGRSFPVRIWSFIKRTTTTEIRFNSDLNDYNPISEYITNNIIKSSFSRNFTYSEKQTEDSRKGVLVAGYGSHFGMIGFRPVMVKRVEDESNQTNSFKEYIVINALGRSKGRMNSLSENISKEIKKGRTQYTKTPVSTNSGDYWSYRGKIPKRRIETVFTSESTGEKIINLIKDFEAKSEENNRLGLPHHMGIMLCGEPGCGKSSLIHAVASETERHILYLNISEVKSDGQLSKLISNEIDWSNFILAIEDIDAAGLVLNRDNPNNKKQKDSVSLSGLLNVLDGILCPDGLIVIATSNHVERLDPALIRPGRFDHTIELKKLGRIEFEKMASVFNKNPNDFDLPLEFEMTGAEMRSMLIS